MMHAHNHKMLSDDSDGPFIGPVSLVVQVHSALSARHSQHSAD
jgi:hypothetical protein